MFRIYYLRFFLSLLLASSSSYLKATRDNDEDTFIDLTDEPEENQEHQQEEEPKKEKKKVLDSDSTNGDVQEALDYLNKCINSEGCDGPTATELFKLVATLKKQAKRKSEMQKSLAPTENSKKKVKHSPPKTGCYVRKSKDLQRIVIVTPKTKAQTNVIYVLSPHYRCLTNRPGIDNSLGSNGSILSTDDIVQLVLDTYRSFLAGGYSDSTFYIGSAASPQDRSGGHLYDLKDKLSRRLYSSLLEKSANKEIKLYMRALARVPKRSQLEFVEELVIIATKANTKGLNAKGPGAKASAFYRDHLQDKVQKMEEEFTEESALNAWEDIDYAAPCKPAQGSLKRERDDDDDNDGNDVLRSPKKIKTEPVDYRIGSILL